MPVAEERMYPRAWAWALEGAMVEPAAATVVEDVIRAARAVAEALEAEPVEPLVVDRLRV